MTKKWLIIILLVAALLRFWDLESGDPVNDEIFYGFRAIGLIDYLGEQYQTTPLEWNDPAIPWWTTLSFHDHPPLVFWLDHLSFELFGENNFALRFPSAALGVLSVFLLYLLGRELYSKEVGLIAAGLLAITLNHVYVSRVGLLESGVICFLLLSCYLFLRSLRTDTYRMWSVASVGLALLAKYMAFVAVPIFTTYALIFRRDYFANKKTWAGCVLAILIVSPVIVYNIAMYRAVGHFDFQLSYMLGQSHPEWQVEPGKEIGSIGVRLASFIPNLINANSWLLLSFALAAIIAFFIVFYKNPRDTWKKHGFLVIAVSYVSLLLAATGPSYRFLTMLTPFLVLGIATFLESLRVRFFKTQHALFAIIVGSFFIFETAYAVNNEILPYPIGSTPWFSSKVRYENYNWGYNALNEYLDREFARKMPALTFDVKYQFLENIRNEALANGLADQREKAPFLIVYGGNFDDSAKVWTMQRRFVYHAWPIITLDEYQTSMTRHGARYFTNAGFQDFYFILSTNAVYTAKLLDTFKNAQASSIKNLRGDEVFRVYKLVITSQTR